MSARVAHIKKGDFLYVRTQGRRDPLLCTAI